MKKTLTLLSLFLLLCGTVSQAAPRNRVKRPATLSLEDARKWDNLFAEGLRQRALGKYDAAYDLFAQTAAIDSMSPALQYQLAQFYLLKKDNKRAYRALLLTQKQASNNAFYLSLLGSLANDAGDYPTAISAFSKVVLLKPTSPEMLLLLSQAYAANGEYIQAARQLDRAEQEAGSREEIVIEQCRLYMMAGDTVQAFAQIDRLPAENPASVRSWIVQASVYLEFAKYEEALRALRQALTLSPQSAQAYLLYAAYYDRIKETKLAGEVIYDALCREQFPQDDALSLASKYISFALSDSLNTVPITSLLDTLLVKYPDDDRFNKMYADYALVHNDLATAKEQIERAIQKEPRSPEYWRVAMGIALKEEDYKAMAALAENALHAMPDDLEILYLAAIASSGAKENQRAIHHSQRAIELLKESAKEAMTPERAEQISTFYGQIGDNYQQIKDMASTYNAYDSALVYSPRNAMVLNNYAYFLSLEKRDLDRAERMIARAIEMSPKNSTFLDTYGWVFFQKENYFLAILYLEMALSQDQSQESQENQEILEHLGDAYFKTGNIDKALEYWVRAQERGGDNPLLLRKIKDKTYHEK